MPASASSSPSSSLLVMQKAFTRSHTHSHTDATNISMDVARFRESIAAVVHIKQTQHTLQASSVKLTSGVDASTTSAAVDCNSHAGTHVGLLLHICRVQTRTHSCARSYIMYRGTRKKHGAAAAAHANELDSRVCRLQNTRECVYIKCARMRYTNSYTHTQAHGT